MTLKKWNWIQPSGRTWKVTTDQEAGTVCMYNEQNQLILGRKNLSAEAVKLLEENFIGIVAATDVRTQEDWNPMYQ